MSVIITMQNIFFEIKNKISYLLRQSFAGCCSINLDISLWPSTAILQQKNNQPLILVLGNKKHNQFPTENDLIGNACRLAVDLTDGIP